VVLQNQATRAIDKIAPMATDVATILK
jgi:hypothetical protein